MIIKKDTCKLALVQAAPVMFDKDKCVEKIITLIGEAAAKKCLRMSQRARS